MLIGKKRGKAQMTDIRNDKGYITTVPTGMKENSQQGYLSINFDLIKYSLQLSQLTMSGKLRILAVR